MYWPRGKVLGGSSSLNAMVYIRGHALDYERWENDERATGWGYDNVLPYFKKAQKHEMGEDEYRGGSGPLNVSVGTSFILYSFELLLIINLDLGNMLLGSGLWPFCSLNLVSILGLSKFYKSLVSKVISQQARPAPRTKIELTLCNDLQ